MSKNKNVNYEELAQNLETWWLKQLDDYFDVAVSFSIPAELIEKSRCANSKEFEERYLKHWIDLDPQTIQEILRILTKYHYAYSKNSLTFEASNRYRRRLEGLYFLLAQIERLNLFPWKEREELKLLYKEPVTQCLRCGQIDKDPNEDTFNDVRRFCHVGDCSGTKKNSTSNAFVHAEKGCCYGLWAQWANHLKQQINRDASSTGEAWGYLKDGCEKLLQQNQRELKYTLQYTHPDSGIVEKGVCLNEILSPAEGQAEFKKIIEGE